MSKHTTEAHEFAFFYQHLPEKSHTEVVIEDEELLHHITGVVRLKAGDACIFFNRDRYAHATIVRIEKRKLVVHIDGIQTTQKLVPNVHVVMPLLKRDSLKEAIYHAAACGVTSINLVTTEKGRSALLEHEFERLEKIIIAAAQQSKHFAIPQLHAPQQLSRVLTSLSDHVLIHCDVDGQSLQTTVDLVRKHTAPQIALCVGPEGDFTQDEKQLLRERKALATKLTPTVLRAEDAVLVACGAIRSLL
jgi:16S rRNA (uracil1498-N3)-methyltransferase